ncbi:hypothetical protein [Agrobacterium rosae]|uniref:hypothetical protein n=1 Tax=Agrobacterium rosae TaxID=1972867 RepID=UPI000CD8225A|nr:hypothetical protein [Agrobacterium rosae]POO56153.1 hypothetical protein CTT39_05245 [Agrobacterium rosae]
MVLVGKAYSILADGLVDLLAPGESTHALIDYVCTNENSERFRFEPVQYPEGGLPEGRVQGKEGFDMSFDDILKHKFIENEELTEKIRSGVLSSKR